MSKILVVGSVHIDILADFDPDTSSNIDKIGKLQYAVGGTAFNVAANLAHHEIDATLYSFLKEDSFITDVVRAEIARRGLSVSYVHNTTMPVESGFVAHTQRGDLVSAVSCMGIQDIPFDVQDVASAMTGCSLVAIECNLAEDQIRQIARIASQHEIPLCVCAVSDSKVTRIFRKFNSSDHPTFRFVVLNKAELLAAVGLSNSVDPNTICHAFSAEYVLVTHGSDGFSVYHAAGSSQDFRVEIESVVSPIGAGDALYAGLCDHFLDRGELDSDQIIHDARRYLGPVLGSDNATPISPKDSPGRPASSPDKFSSAALIALAALCISATATIYGFFGPGISLGLYGALLFVISVFSGLAGCHIELLLGRRERDSIQHPQFNRLLVRSTLGIAAGLFAGLLYFFPQLSVQNGVGMNGDGETVEYSMLVLLPFSLIAGFVGGLTSDALLSRLKSVRNIEVDQSKCDSDS